MAFDFGNSPFKKKESDPFQYSPPYTPGSGNSFPTDSNWPGASADPFGVPPSTGFQNPPKKRIDLNPVQKPLHVDAPEIYAPPRVKKAHTQINIPWRIILPILLVVAVLVFLYVNRYAIASFLSQLVSWIVVIAILVFIIKLLLFPGGRDRRR